MKRKLIIFDNATLLTLITVTFISSDCGSAHIYETPVLLYSPDLFTSSNSGSTSFSSRSVESDLTSSTEVDSGYSSSIDIRRFTLSNSENSPEQQKANFGALYENTSFRKQNTQAVAYELMSPPTGSVSSPIPIPKQGTGETRFPREQRGTPSTPPSEDQKCPLDFSNFNAPHESSSASPPLPPKMSSSLPISSVTQSQGKPPRLSKTVSPTASKKSPLDSGIGESFAQEMFALMKRASVDKSSDASPKKEEEEDIYEDLSRPAVPANPSDTRVATSSTREPLKARNAHSYENHSIPVKEQMSKKGEPKKDQNSHHEVPDHQNDRVRCKSAYQMQNNHQLRDARSNTWPTQQNYDNHKLKNADAEASSGSSCYDNHRLRPSDINVPSSDAFYDNWKIKGDLSGVSHKSNKPCYENVELQMDKTVEHREELSQETVTRKPEEETSLNKAQTADQNNENCVVTSPQTSYENFTPQALQRSSDENDQKYIDDSLYENCEISAKKKEPSKNGSLCRDQTDNNLRELSHSWPTNCHCVGVVPDEAQGLMSMILEKRNPPALTRVGSADAINADADKEDPLSLNIPGNNLDTQDHPIPPPRWKRITRSKRTQSLLVGCSQQRWKMNVSPELAAALRKRWNETVVGLPTTETNQDSNSVSDPNMEALGVKKPALPPRANKNSVNAPEPLISNRSNAYENVTLPSKLCDEEPCPPQLPPKLQRSNGNNTVKNSSLRSRALHYENVEGVNGFHAIGNQNVDLQQEIDSPPPLPRKLSQTKVPPLIPCRVDLEQKC